MTCSARTEALGISYVVLVPSPRPKAPYPPYRTESSRSANSPGMVSTHGLSSYPDGKMYETVLPSSYVMASCWGHASSTVADRGVLMMGCWIIKQDRTDTSQSHQRS